MSLDSLAGTPPGTKENTTNGIQRRILDESRYAETTPLSSPLLFVLPCESIVGLMSVWDIGEGVTVSSICYCHKIVVCLKNQIDSPARLCTHIHATKFNFSENYA